MHERDTHKRNSFITLTYDNEHLPKDLSLDIKHFQLFVKRLRKKLKMRWEKEGNNPEKWESFRYFHCGEYGEKRQRPHYHACLFGEDFIDDRTHVKTDKGNKLYASEELTTAWGKGGCIIGNLTYQSAAYVSSYIIDKLTPGQDENSKERYLKKYERINTRTGEITIAKPEYVSMSRGGTGGKGGIGAAWFDKYAKDVYPADEVIHKARRFRPPRYYDNKLPEDQLAEIKEKRQIEIKKHGKDLTPERLKVREKVLERSLKRYEKLL